MEKRNEPIFEVLQKTAIGINSLSKVINGGLWSFAVYTDKMPGHDHPVTWTGSFRKMLGFSGETEFPNFLISWTSRIHPADRDRVLQALTLHLADYSGGTCFDVEYRFRIHSGDYLWFRSTGATVRERADKPATFMGTLFNIHAQKALELEMEFLLTRFALISFALTEGPWDMKVVYDDPLNPQNEFWWSPQFRYALGFKEEDEFPAVLGSWSDRLHPEDRKRTLQAFSRHLTDNTGETPYSIDYRLRLRNGEYRWFHARGTTVRDEQGRPLRVAGTIRDIEHEKQKNLEIQARLNRYCEIINTLAKKQGSDPERTFIGPEMADLVKNIEKYAKVEAPLLITGESGVGKEVVADLIHNFSDRKSAPFLKINCGAIPEALLESELFGYEDGAFTGARRGGKMVFFELADHGTVLLDEIGDLPLALQVKMLRFVQNKDFFRIGGKRLIKVNTRIIAATNRNLEVMVANNEFRADLYYRLHVLTIHIPALRQRPGDIVPLSLYFLKKYNEKYHVNKALSPEALRVFTAYNWPGNIRELENFIERLVVTADKDLIDVESMPELMKKSLPAGEEKTDSIVIPPYKEAKEQFEREYLLRAIDSFGSARKVAEKIKVDHSTIVKKAAKLGIKLQQWQKVDN